MNHLFISLPDPDEKVIQDLNTIMFRFIWDDKPDKIKREVTVLNYEYGGLKVLDIYSFISALKSTWIKRYLSVVGKWKYLLEQQVNMPLIINSGTYSIEKCCLKFITNSG